MKFILQQFHGGVTVIADEIGLGFFSDQPCWGLEEPKHWPPVTIATPAGLKTAIQIEQCLEMGLAKQSDGGGIQIFYEDFMELHRLKLELTRDWTEWSPFLLQIGRISDIGRDDFYYEYRFRLGAKEIPLERIGYYVRRESTQVIYHLDDQTYSLLTTMDNFNELSLDKKTKSESWLSFAKVKGCAESVGAQLDRYLDSNDVIIPSSIALEIHTDNYGKISFIPKCKELPDDELTDAFLRNPDEQDIYSIDLEGNRRVRLVLDPKQREVLHRMKQVRNLKGEAKRNAIEHPEQFFDGVLESVIIPYGRRVVGIGDFPFTPTPQLHHNGTIFKDDTPSDDGELYKYEPSHIECIDSLTKKPIRIDFADNKALNKFREKVSNALVNGDKTIEYENRQISIDEDLYKALGEKPILNKPKIPLENQKDRANKYLLIYTDDEYLKEWDKEEVSKASKVLSQLKPFERPLHLDDAVDLKPHQIIGIQWLQNCHSLKKESRKGALLADDMGLGKTLQILAYLAWCIENDPDLGLSSPAAPWCPILIIVPLVLLDNEVWQYEMKKFIKGEGEIFEPILNFHGDIIKTFRRPELMGREVIVGQSVLDIARFKQNRVVITNYETIVNYQHSFAQLVDGKPIWSVIITDEAQEYKTPNTKISHAIKSLDPAFRVASTGTPVENRLLDLWNLMDFLQPALLETAKDFSKKYESGEEDTIGLRIEELRAKLLFKESNAFIVRRCKSELHGLPKKEIVKIECEMSEFDVAMHTSLIQMLPEHRKNKTHFKILHQLVQLYQHPQLLKNDQGYMDPSRLIIESAKLRGVIDLLHKIKQKREKAVIFARFINMQQILAAVLSAEFDLHVQIINGSPGQKQGIISSGSTGRARSARKQMLDNFKTKPGFNLIVLSPFVAGIGLTITEANHVIHYGRWWNPAIEAQATDRVYRIGQEKDVYVYLPILIDPRGRIRCSFDERLHTLLENKANLADDFLRPIGNEGSWGDELTDSLLEEQADQGNSLEPLSIEDVDRLSPLDFEALIAVALEKRGHKSILTAKGNDGGADVIASREMQIILIQVKHSRSGAYIGKDAIGDIIGASNIYDVTPRHSLSLRIITNTKLINDAEIECRKMGIEIMDRPDLARYLRENPITLTQVLKKSEERCLSFSEGFQRLKNILQAT